MTIDISEKRTDCYGEVGRYCTVTLGASEIPIYLSYNDDETACWAGFPSHPMVDDHDGNELILAVERLVQFLDSAMIN